MPKKKILSVDLKKDKPKWIIVAILSVMLLFVLLYNTVLSSKESVRKPYVEEQHDAPGGFNLSSDVLELLRPTAPAVVLDEGEKEDLIPLLMTDLFAFRKKQEREEKPADTPVIEEDDFTLKGTIVDGTYAVAFINDQVLDVGESIHGFTVAEITGEKVVIRSEQKAITLILEDSLSEAF